MSTAPFLRALSLTIVALSLPAGLCAIHALLSGDVDALAGLIMTALGGCFLWAVLNAALSGVGPAITNERAGLLLVLVCWLLLPLLACPPFLTSGVATSLPFALFETISNLSTAGASAGPDAQTDSIRLWRASLQWLGGSASVTVAIAIFSPLAATAAGQIRMRTPFAAGPLRLGHTAIVTASLYLAVAAIAALCLIAAGADPVHGIEIAVAATTTSAPLASTPVPSGPIGPIILSLALFLGATNVCLYAGHGARRHVRSDPEAPVLLAAILLVGVGLCIRAGSPDPRLFLEALSFLTTSGIDLTSAPNLITLLPAPIPDMLALIGGSALSTAGGIKIIRLLSLGRMARTEFLHLAFSHTPGQDPRRGEIDKTGILVFLIAIPLAISVLLVALTLTNMPMNSALRAAIGAVSSHGPLMEAALADDVSAWRLAILSLGCVIGRIEMLAFASILGFGLWRR